MSRSRLPLGLIAALWVAEMASAFESAMILAALKALIAAFGDPARVGWLITGFLIVSTVAAALVGRLGDIYGRRRCLIVVLALGVIGSLVSALSTGFPMLLFGRVLQGATGAIMPLAIGLVRENLPKDRMHAAVGLMISGASVGTAIGLVAGGLIVDHFAWHGIFIASAGFCIASILAVLAAVPSSPGHAPTQRVEWLSGILFAPGVTLVLIYVSSLRSRGATDGMMLAMLAAGVALTAWWWYRSLRSANPLIAVRAFANRTIAVGSIVSALVAMGTLQIIVFFSLLMQAPTWTVAGLGLTATMAGIAKLPSNLSSVLAGPLGGWLAGRGGGRFAIIVGGIVTTLGWVMAWVHTGSLPIVIAELIVISFGTTMLFAVTPTVIAQAAPPERVSETTGLIGVVRGLFMGIGAQMVTTLLASDTVTRGGETYPSPFAYQLTIGVIVLLSAAAVVASFAFPRDPAPLS